MIQSLLRPDNFLTRYDSYKKNIKKPNDNRGLLLGLWNTEFVNHIYVAERGFQFRWMKMKGIYADFPKSITLFSNHIKWNPSSEILLASVVAWPICSIVILILLRIIFNIPVTFYGRLNCSIFWNNLIHHWPSKRRLK